MVEKEHVNLEKIIIWSDPKWVSLIEKKFTEIQVKDVSLLFTRSFENKDEQWVMVISESTLGQYETALKKITSSRNFNFVNIIVISRGNSFRKSFAELSEFIFFTLPEEGVDLYLQKILERVLHYLHLFFKGHKVESELVSVYKDMRSLTRVGQALLLEKDFDKLIELILEQARKLAQADGGSIYIVERPEKKGEKPTKLRFKKSALNLNAGEFTLNIDKNSIAGYVAMQGHHISIDDVYNISEEKEYHFNPDFDKAHNYRTRSMLLIPMKNHRDEVIGVIQLINKKAHGDKVLTLDDMRGNGVIPFTDRDYELLSALAGQAGMAIENTFLVSEIKELFEGFVKASVKAIEQRDPTTSGHSSRVAAYTEELALCVDRSDKKALKEITFNKEQITELRYAALLHDFGKVGVREKVLVKAKKLYDSELSIIQWRFRYIIKVLEKEHFEMKYQLLKMKGAEELEKIEAKMDDELEKNKQKIKGMFDAIVRANEPTILEEGDFKTLESLTSKIIKLDDGLGVRFLERSEFLSLSIKKGTLDEKERGEIESHVSHTYQFLIQIPWTRDLQGVPDIAHAHHEKLDGTGYPLGIEAAKIPVQSRMMAISDIYDALTAMDRPYKKALSAERAIDILVDESKRGHVDKDLLDVFIEANVFRKHITSIIH